MVVGTWGERLARVVPQTACLCIKTGTVWVDSGHSTLRDLPHIKAVHTGVRGRPVRVPVLQVFLITQVPLTNGCSVIANVLQYLCYCNLRWRQGDLSRTVEVTYPIAVIAVCIRPPHTVSVVVSPRQHGPSGWRAHWRSTVEARELHTISSSCHGIQVRCVCQATIVAHVTVA